MKLNQFLAMISLSVGMMLNAFGYADEQPILTNKPSDSNDCIKLQKACKDQSIPVRDCIQRVRECYLLNPATRTPVPTPQKPVAQTPTPANPHPAWHFGPP